MTDYSLRAHSTEALQKRGVERGNMYGDLGPTSHCIRPVMAHNHNPSTGEG